MHKAANTSILSSSPFSWYPLVDTTNFMFMHPKFTCRVFVLDLITDKGYKLNFGYKLLTTHKLHNKKISKQMLAWN